ncbi:hypothetical protein FBU30_006927 [Linnemannia zychae]|nr:hypothetical protein FBU30_006927 [Linnemannia zychae]
MMRFILCATLIALTISQAAAVVPIPVKECTKSYVVEPGTPGCQAFARKFGIAVEDLIKWNQKLRTDCANLDVGYPMCVSVTPGECCLNENPKGALVPRPGVPPQPNLWDDTPYAKTSSKSSTTTTTTSANTTTTTTTTSTTTTTVPTTSRSSTTANTPSPSSPTINTTTIPTGVTTVAPPPLHPAVTSPAMPAAATTSFIPIIPNIIDRANKIENGTADKHIKHSMIVAIIGVIFSAVFIL